MIIKKKNKKEKISKADPGKNKKKSQKTSEKVVCSSPCVYVRNVYAVMYLSKKYSKYFDTASIAVFTSSPERKVGLLSSNFSFGEIFFYLSTAKIKMVLCSSGGLNV